MKHNEGQKKESQQKQKRKENESSVGNERDRRPKRAAALDSL